MMIATATTDDESKTSSAVESHCQLYELPIYLSILFDLVMYLTHDLLGMVCILPLQPTYVVDRLTPSGSIVVVLVRPFVSLVCFFMLLS